MRSASYLLKERTDPAKPLDYISRGNICRGGASIGMAKQWLEARAWYWKSVERCDIHMDKDGLGFTAYPAGESLAWEAQVRAVEKER